MHHMTLPFGLRLKPNQKGVPQNGTHPCHVESLIRFVGPLVMELSFWTNQGGGKSKIGATAPQDRTLQAESQAARLGNLESSGWNRCSTSSLLLEGFQVFRCICSLVLFSLSGLQKKSGLRPCRGLERYVHEHCCSFSTSQQLARTCSHPARGRLLK